MASTPTTSAPSLALASLHERLGATLTPLDGNGSLVPARYGSTEEEYRALREGCGVADLSWRGLLEVTGKDRQRFLNAYVTCDVKAIAPGQGAYGFFTNPQGRILSDLVLAALEDRFWMLVGPGQEEGLAGHLQKYILADRVEIRPLEGVVPLALIGPRAGEALGIAELPAPWSHVRAAVEGVEVTVQGSERFGQPAWILWAPAAEAGALLEGLAAGGARPVGFEAQETLRVEAGIARFGRDFGPDNFPQETGAEEAAVSYTKGCYLGQEVVARIHYRGGVQKGLRGVVFETDSGVASGTEVFHDGRPAGTVTTVVHSFALGRPAGLAILHKRAAEPGTRLQMDSIESVGTVEVRELPLAP
ncbi:MAG TPA: glycine cleavage T C-terminal barrel domain-containing protein [Thermoanaerobaculia bacterium]|nr:glycine cleavage T C-terminal barrel domain-containing protein [Thermoanaerobaculia bacterium]